MTNVNNYYETNLCDFNTNDELWAFEKKDEITFIKFNDSSIFEIGDNIILFTNLLIKNQHR